MIEGQNVAESHEEVREGRRQKTLVMEPLSKEDREVAVAASKEVLDLAQEYLGEDEVVVRSDPGSKGPEFRISKSSGSREGTSPIQITRQRVTSSHIDHQMLRNGEAWMFTDSTVKHWQYYEDTNPVIGNLTVIEDLGADNVGRLLRDLKASTQVNEGKTKAANETAAEIRAKATEQAVKKPE